MNEQAVFDALKYRVDVDMFGTRRYYNSDNQLHRMGGPAVEYVNGHVEWWQNGLPHRIDGPAIEWCGGTKFWYQYDIRHRTDGPAVEYPSGRREWYQNGQLHRTDGPAIEYANGCRRWFIKGAEMTEAEFNQLVVKMSEVAVFETLKYRIEVDECGTRRYYNDVGQLHRIDGPAVEMSDGGKSWYQNGLLHRIDGPAYECFDSFRYNSKYWYQNGMLHRIDGPAVERSDDQHYNIKYWYQNGLLHRIDGPAIEDTDGNTSWFINGKLLLEDDFNQSVKRL